MAKYFMSGTKYEQFERMMMSTSRRVYEPDPPREDKVSRKKPNFKEGGVENHAISFDT